MHVKGAAKFMSDLFLKKDKEKAEKDINLYGELMKNAIEAMATAEFRLGAAYHENISRTLHRLADMKQVNEEVDLQIKQLEATLFKKQQQDKLIKRSGVKS